ncbi:C-type lectin domain family 2 member F-like [Mus caroli]|uniref:C-type lectin domain family 2 member F-like n=1 Tax=Mus caroli TaxID=10089 RepID=A0A6P5Q4K1_MUSCR|nr:C-type lectin domain family 2 member F-like [Mus caroli]
MLTDTSPRLPQTSHELRHRRLMFDSKKVLTLWTLLGGAVAVLLWGFFSFPRKFTVTRTARNKTCEDGVKLCPKDWNKLRRNCFSSIQHKSSWLTANDTCELHDATLAVFIDKTELEILMNQMQEMKTYWIGLHRQNLLGIWVWTNGSKYNNLHDIQDHGQCAFVHQKGIDSTNCEDQKEFICTREGQCP